MRLEPAPFGIGWRVERQGRFFVVRDDREIAAYDDVSGRRLWKRTAPTNVAFVGERAGRHVSIVPSEDGATIEIALADLSTGAFETMLRVDGTMRYLGAHGSVTDTLLFFATDERDVFAVDLDAWSIRQRHPLEGTHVLRPVLGAGGVHVAAVGHQEGRLVTRIATLDRERGDVTAIAELPGWASSLSATANGLVLEGRSSPGSPVERTTYRPETPHVRLVVAKHLDFLVRTDAPRRATLYQHLPGPQIVEVANHRANTRPGDELLPAPRERAEEGSGARDGNLGLLALLGAESRVLRALAAAPPEMRWVPPPYLGLLGLTLRDPRIRWSAASGRDPSLLDLAENRDGDTIATYHYPLGASGKVPVVLVRRTTGEAQWLADDFDVWFADVLHEALARAPQAVHVALERLALPADFPRPAPHVIPPRWFFEAHDTRWTLLDVERALADGDVEGAERMLVAVARTAHHEGLASATVKMKLASVYTTLGWDHHRATVVETW